MRIFMIVILLVVVFTGIYFWQRNKTDLPAPDVQSSQSNFTETGNIVSGTEEGTWDLVYEKPGKPALRVRLQFDDRSFCEKGSAGEIISCEAPLWDIGSRVKVSGNEAKGTVDVITLTVLN